MGLFTKANRRINRRGWVDPTRCDRRPCRYHPLCPGRRCRIRVDQVGRIPPAVNLRARFERPSRQNCAAKMRFARPFKKAFAVVLAAASAAGLVMLTGGCLVSEKARPLPQERENRLPASGDVAAAGGRPTARQKGATTEIATLTNELTKAPISLSPGERVGVRASVPLTFLSFLLSNTLAQSVSITADDIEAALERFARIVENLKRCNASHGNSAWSWAGGARARS